MVASVSNGTGGWDGGVKIYSQKTIFIGEGYAVYTVYRLSLASKPLA